MPPSLDLICTVHCLITKFLPKRKSEKLLEVLPMVGHLSISMTVTRTSTSSCMYVLPLSPDCDILFFELAAASEF